MSVRVLGLALLTLTLVGCGGGDGAADSARPTVVVTTSILGDVVGNLAGDEFDVVTIMPVGADPHDFQPSAQQVAQIGEADVLIANGGGFEVGLADVIESAEADGVPTFEALGAVETLDFGDETHADHEADGAEEVEVHEEEAHEDEAHEDEAHEEGVDPHFFTDPARMAVATDAIAKFLADNVDGVDADVLRLSAEEYVDQLEALDAEVEELLSVIPEDRRVLVTNHEVFGYFADRYDFEVVGTVIPGGSTTDGADAAALDALAQTVTDRNVPAIFAETSSSGALAETLADEAGDVEVVELFSESLGDPDSEGGTYLDMVRTNGERIAAALSA
ncbi:MAG: metal ABC transporter substrate-binding protein [Ilumatobacteraceae bacterium]